MSKSVLVACATYGANAALGPVVKISGDVSMPTINLGTCCGSDPKVGIPSWLAAGGVGIDTAWDYHDQVDIKNLLAQLGVDRSKVFITTKVPAGLGNATDCAVDPNASLKYVEDDLRQLGVNYVDLVILHGPCELQAAAKDPTAANNALWQGLQLALAKKMTRAIGVSNYQTASLQALQGPKPALNQCFMGISGTGFFPPHLSRDEVTIAYCQANGIQYEAYDTIKGCPQKDARLVAIAAKYQKTPVQVCLRWTLERNVVIAAGTGNNTTTAPDYAKQNLDIYSWSLTSDEVNSLNSIDPPPVF